MTKKIIMRFIMSHYNHGDYKPFYCTDYIFRGLFFDWIVRDYGGAEKLIVIRRGAIKRWQNTFNKNKR